MLEQRFVRAASKVLSWSFFVMSTCISQAAGAPAHNEPLYSFEGSKYTIKDLGPAERQALYEAEKNYYDQVIQVVEHHLFEHYLTRQAKKQGKARGEVEATIAKVDISEQQAKQWYDANQARLGGRPFEPIKGEIINFLKSQQIEEKKVEVVKQVKKDGRFAFLLPKPVAPTLDIAIAGYPIKGPEKAAITIVEFADYQCPHCKEASHVVKNLLKKFEGKVRFVFMDFPLRPQSIAALVAEGAVCADRQNKFWDYHYLAFEQQADLRMDSPQNFAKTLGLDEAKFQSCLQDPTVKQKVENSRQEGERIGVQGTPSIYINGRKYDGYSEATLLAAIEELLKSSPR